MSRPADRQCEAQSLAILDLRPNCECCDKDLPPDGGEAFICTYECTFCRGCTEGVLKGFCPNCIGNLTPRPIRPPAGPVGGLKKFPASTKRVLRSQGCTTPDPGLAAVDHTDGAGH